jgi:uncharacterized protein YqgQ
VHFHAERPNDPANCRNLMLVRSCTIDYTFLWNRFLSNESWVEMRTLYDVQQLLKKFGIIVYIGDRLADLELMELELRQLYQARVLENREYETALLIIRQEKRLEKEKKIEGERNG